MTVTGAKLGSCASFCRISGNRIYDCGKATWTY